MTRRKLYNQFYIDGDVAFIDLGNGQCAVIDAEDVEKCRPHLWRAWTVGGPTYVRSRLTTLVERKLHGAHFLLHRFITDCPKDKIIDHVDRDGLNNRKSNFRHCTQNENAKNRGPIKANSTGFKGVKIDRRTGKFVARITSDKREVHLGVYETAATAAKAYNAAALVKHGAFASLNDVGLHGLQ